MKVVIIGNGISGTTAARTVRKLDASAEITLISGEGDYFFSRTALMYVYMGHMRKEDIQPYEPWFWEKNRIQLKKAWVQTIDTKQQNIVFQDGTTLSYDKLVIATGSASNKFGWPGQDLKNVTGLYDYQDLESMEAASPILKRAVIVGGGLIGIEMAEMFHSRHIPVTLLVREVSYWDNILPKEESAMISRHIKELGFDLRLETELDYIEDNGHGAVQAVVTKTGERIPCEYVGLTAGVSPNVGFIKGGDIEVQRGVVVNNNLQTNVPNVYAIGDCAQLSAPQAGRRPIEAIWYTGRMMGEVVAYNICGKAVTYDPGIWFNSAKFLEIEYQVYGDIQASPPENQQALYWEHEDGRRAIRIMYDKNAPNTVLGFNLMGVRYRHEVCEAWLKRKAPIEEVLEQLALANFDPEFYASFEQAVLSIYEAQTGRKISLKSKRGLSGVLQFLKQPFAAK